MISSTDPLLPSKLTEWVLSRDTGKETPKAFLGSYRFKFTSQLSLLPGCVTLGTGLHLSEAILTCKVERITAPPRGGCEG